MHVAQEKAQSKKSYLLKAVCLVALAIAFAAVLSACSGTGTSDLKTGDVAATVSLQTASDDSGDDESSDENTEGSSDENTEGSSDESSDENTEGSSDESSDDESSDENTEGSSDDADDESSDENTVTEDVYENEVTNYIENNLRVQNGLTDDDAWGEWLVENGYTPETIREAVIDTYVERILVDHGAEELGVVVEDSDIDAYIDNMKTYYGDDDTWESALEQAGYTDDSYRDEVELNLKAEGIEDSFKSDKDPSDEDMLTYAQMFASYYDGAKRSSHILFSEDDKDKAQEVLDDINSGKIKFKDAVKKYSTDSGTVDDGGDVGWDVMTSLDDDYQSALDNMKKGEISDLVKTQYGYHIIKCTDVFKAPDEVTSVDQLPSDWLDTIKDTIKDQDAYNAYQAWLDNKREEAEIDINPMPEGLPYDIDLKAYENGSGSSANGSGNIVGGGSADIEGDVTGGESGDEDVDADTDSNSADSNSDDEDAEENSKDSSK